MLLVSACLVGLHTRFDGGTRSVPALLDLVKKGVAIPVCPEQLGGLPTPRPAAEIQGGSGYDVLAGRAFVQNKEGCDITAYFIRGAKETLRLARLARTSVAILKARSPSCGNKAIYNGAFRKITRPGPGVTAALLMESGIVVYSEEDLNSEVFAKIL